MDVLCYRDIAKLVLGYLIQHSCEEVCLEFSYRSEHLQDEYKQLQNGCIPMTIATAGNLVNIIQEYCQIQTIIHRCLECLTFEQKRVSANKALVEKLQHLLSLVVPETKREYMVAKKRRRITPIKLVNTPAKVQRRHSCEWEVSQKRARLNAADRSDETIDPNYQSENDVDEDSASIADGVEADADRVVNKSAEKKKSSSFRRQQEQQQEEKKDNEKRPELEPADGQHHLDGDEEAPQLNLSLSSSTDENVLHKVASEMLLENTAFHDKLVTTINKVIESKEQTQRNAKEKTSLDDQLEDAIKNIISITEEDPIFTEILDDIVHVTKQTKSASTSLQTPTGPTKTSTPHPSKKVDNVPQERNADTSVNNVTEPETTPAAAPVTPKSIPKPVIRFTPVKQMDTLKKSMEKPLKANKDADDQPVDDAQVEEEPIGRRLRPRVAKPPPQKRGAKGSKPKKDLTKKVDIIYDEAYIGPLFHEQMHPNNNPAQNIINIPLANPEDAAVLLGNNIQYYLVPNDSLAQLTDHQQNMYLETEFGSIPIVLNDPNGLPMPEMMVNVPSDAINENSDDFMDIRHGEIIPMPSDSPDISNLLRFNNPKDNAKAIEVGLSQEEICLPSDVTTSITNRGEGEGGSSSKIDSNDKENILIGVVPTESRTPRGNQFNTLKSKCSSTPRRSHVRVLTFTTPPKELASTAVQPSTDSKLNTTKRLLNTPKFVKETAIALKESDLLRLNLRSRDHATPKVPKSIKKRTLNTSTSDVGAEVEKKDDTKSETVDTPTERGKTKKASLSPKDPMAEWQAMRDAYKSKNWDQALRDAIREEQLSNRMIIPTPKKVRKKVVNKKKPETVVKEKKKRKRKIVVVSVIDDRLNGAVDVDDGEMNNETVATTVPETEKQADAPEVKEMDELILIHEEEPDEEIGKPVESQKESIESNTVQAAAPSALVINENNTEQAAATQASENIQSKETESCPIEDSDRITPVAEKDDQSTAKTITEDVESSAFQQSAFVEASNDSMDSINHTNDLVLQLKDSEDDSVKSQPNTPAAAPVEVTTTTIAEDSESVSKPDTPITPPEPPKKRMLRRNKKDEEDALTQADKSDERSPIAVNEGTTKATPEIEPAPLERTLPRDDSYHGHIMETPYKESSDLVPKTPRFVLPQSTPAAKGIKEPTSITTSVIKCSEIETPSFAITPGLKVTPERVESPRGNNFPTRPTDYSSSSSYYKPDESEDIDRKLEAMFEVGRKKGRSDSAEGNTSSQPNPPTTLTVEEKLAELMVETSTTSTASSSTTTSSTPTTTIIGASETVTTETTTTTAVTATTVLEEGLAKTPIKMDNPKIIERVKSFTEMTNVIIKSPPHYTFVPEATVDKVVGAVEEAIAKANDDDDSCSSISLSSSSSSSSSTSDSDDSTTTSDSSDDEAEANTETVAENKTVPMTSVNEDDDDDEKKDRDWVAKQDQLQLLEMGPGLIAKDGELRFPLRNWVTTHKEKKRTSADAALLISASVNSVAAHKNARWSTLNDTQLGRARELELKRLRTVERMKMSSGPQKINLPPIAKVAPTKVNTTNSKSNNGNTSKNSNDIIADKQNHKNSAKTTKTTVKNSNGTKKAVSASTTATASSSSSSAKKDKKGSNANKNNINNNSSSTKGKVPSSVTSSSSSSNKRKRTSPRKIEQQVSDNELPPTRSLRSRTNLEVATKTSAPAVKEATKLLAAVTKKNNHKTSSGGGGGSPNKTVSPKKRNSSTKAIKLAAEMTTTDDNDDDKATKHLAMYKEVFGDTTDGEGEPTPIKRPPRKSSASSKRPPEFQSPPAPESVAEPQMRKPDVVEPVAIEERVAPTEPAPQPAAATPTPVEQPPKEDSGQEKEDDSDSDDLYEEQKYEDCVLVTSEMQRRSLYRLRHDASFKPNQELINGNKLDPVTAQMKIYLKEDQFARLSIWGSDIYEVDPPVERAADANADSQEEPELAKVDAAAAATPIATASGSETGNGSGNNKSKSKKSVSGTSVKAIDDGKGSPPGTGGLTTAKATTIGSTASSSSPSAATTSASQESTKNGTTSSPESEVQTKVPKVRAWQINHILDRIHGGQP